MLMTKVMIFKKESNMKKIVIATMVALAATTASAVELGVNATRDYSGTDRNGFGVSVGQKFGRVGAQVGVERFTAGSNDQDRYTALGSFDLAKVGPVTVAAKGGVAYLNNQRSNDGFAAVVGAGASLPLNKTLSLGLDVTRQIGQDRVSQFDGNLVTTSLRVKF